MKSLLPALAALLPLGLTAAPSLKLELVGPGEAITMSKADLAMAAATGKMLTELDDLTADGKLDKEDLKKHGELDIKIEEARKLAQGVSLKLRITNTGKEPFTFRYGPDTSTNFLNLTGPGAIQVPFTGGMTMEFRMPPEVTIPSGKSKDFEIAELRYGSRDMDRWLISKPGTYTVSLRMVASLELPQREMKEIELKSDEITFEVKEGE